MWNARLRVAAGVAAEGNDIPRLRVAPPVLFCAAYRAGVFSSRAGREIVALDKARDRTAVVHDEGPTNTWRYRPEHFWT